MILSLLFYSLVRLRMNLGPRMRDRFGERARMITWGVTIGLMVLLANAGLVALRWILHEQHGIDAPFLHEMVYAVFAFVIGFILVNRHVTRNRD